MILTETLAEIKAKTMILTYTLAETEAKPMLLTCQAAGGAAELLGCRVTGHRRGPTTHTRADAVSVQKVLELVAASAVAA